jgi:hypothetical protein
VAETGYRLHVHPARAPRSQCPGHDGSDPLVSPRLTAARRSVKALSSTVSRQRFRIRSRSSGNVRLFALWLCHFEPDHWLHAAGQTLCCALGHVDERCGSACFVIPSATLINGSLANGAQGRNRTTDTRIFSPLRASTNHKNTVAFRPSCRGSTYFVSRRARIARPALAVPEPRVGLPDGP